MTKNKQAQAIIDQQELDIAEDNRATGKDIATIEQVGNNLDERQVREISAEQYLDGMKYNLDDITTKVKIHLEHIVQSYVAVGRYLLAVKKVEGHGKFTQWLEDNFPFSVRTARQYMLVARRLEQQPELAQFAAGGAKKALVLLDMPEDYQTEYIAQGSIDGEPLDKYITMSHKELREKLKKLEHDKDKVVAEETKGLKKERDMLLAENKRLQRFEPTEEITPEWSLELIQKVEKATFALSTLCQKIMIDERLVGNMALQAKIESHMFRARKEIEDTAREWDAKFNCLYEG